VVGVPTFDTQMGIGFNGTTDYIRYTNKPQFQNTGFYSIAIEFYSDLMPDGLDHAWYILDSYNSGAAKRIVIAKMASAGYNYQIRVMCGATDGNLTSELATYKPHWKIGRNVLVVTCASGASKIYLNGADVTTYGAGAFTSTSDETALTLGTYYSGADAGMWPSYISSVKVYRHSSVAELLTAQEAAGFWERSTYRYPAAAVATLPMQMSRHDAVGFRTLDASGRGADFLLGAGDGGASTPTKLTLAGYSLDGTDYFKRTTALGIATDFSVVMSVKPSSLVGDRALWGCRNSAGGYSLSVYGGATGGPVLKILHNLGGAGITTTVPLLLDQLQHYCFVYTDATRVMQVYRNGILAYTSAALTDTNGHNNGFWLGALPTPEWFWKGSIHYAAVYPRTLSYSQAADAFVQQQQNCRQV
jgi:hypothetical protein